MKCQHKAVVFVIGLGRMGHKVSDRSKRVILQQCFSTFFIRDTLSCL